MADAMSRLYNGKKKKKKTSQRTAKKSVVSPPKTKDFAATNGRNTG